MTTDLPAKRIFKRYHSDKHLSDFLPTRWREKSTGMFRSMVLGIRIIRAREMAIELTQEIGRNITTMTEDTRETTFLFQRFSMAL